MTITAMVALSLCIILAVILCELADRAKRKAIKRDIVSLQQRIADAQRKHGPRKLLYRKLVEAKRRELVNE